ncbi:MAG: L-serine ammonia-lyase, iron-sulfur-dependent, subunit beta [Clostridiales bacterium]|nr:L-serine ammonia-lyase, iron-sulfur-dependent, subunit beta [Clostridiales bacterium]
MNVFDIIGPVMIGPSSSHTAGAARIGYVARRILAQRPVRAEIGLSGSFARTCRGHGTDRALIAGILGMKPDDQRLPHSLDLAREQGLSYSFSTVKLPKRHPNTALVRLAGAGGEAVEVEGASVGGGNILITRLNGMESAFTGQHDTLIIPHRDTHGVIATVTQALALYGVNIGNFKLTRPVKGSVAIMTIEVDGGITKELVALLRSQPNVANVVYLHAIEGEAQKHD